MDEVGVGVDEVAERADTRPTHCVEDSERGVVVFLEGGGESGEVASDGAFGAVEGGAEGEGDAALRVGCGGMGAG